MSTGKHPTTEELTRLTQAWDWVLRLRGDSPGQDELNEWLLWYESDARNKQAFDQASAIASQAPEAVDQRGPLAPSSWRRGSVAKTRARKRRRKAWVSAATAAGLAVLALQFGLDVPRPVTGFLQTLASYAGSTAEPRVERTVLPDGSRADLATRSTMQLQYNDEVRLLNMTDGVAYFTVVHDPERPFIVRAGDFYIRATGTAFNVRYSGERTVVTVTEGTVDVYPVARQPEPAAPPPPDALRIEAGREVVWDSPAVKPVVKAVDPAHALAWQQGRLEYLNEPLDSAIADINRYSNRKIVIRDPALGELVFSGAVLTDSADVWVQSLPKLFPVDLLRDADGNIVLVSRQASSS